MSKFNEISKKLDLSEHINNLSSFFARQKSPILEGDINIHYKFIKALDDVELIELPLMPNLDSELLKLSKEGILTLDTIYLFIKQIYFFNKLKAKTMPPIWQEFLNSIEVPKDILEIASFFNDKGELEESKVSELYEVKRALNSLKERKKEVLRSLINSSKLQEFLIDSQIHLYYGQ